MSKIADAKFSALVLMSPEKQEIRVWIPELLPTESGHRSGAEWVHEFLSGVMSYDHWKDLIPDGQEVYENFQLLLSGTVNGYRDYYGEYDEDVDFDDEVKYSKLPEGYFE